MVVQKDLGNEVELLQQNSQEESFTEGFSSRMVEQTAFNRLSWVSKKEHPNQGTLPKILIIQKMRSKTLFLLNGIITHLEGDNA